MNDTIIGPILKWALIIGIPVILSLTLLDKISTKKQVQACRMGWHLAASKYQLVSKDKSVADIREDSRNRCQEWMFR